MEGVTLTIPPNALSETSKFTITKLTTPVPDGFGPYSPVFQFEPAGLTFASPVKVRMPFTGTGPHPTVFWSEPNAAGFAALATVVSNGTAEAEVTHFSQGFVADPLVGHWTINAVLVSRSCMTSGAAPTYVELSERLVFGADGQVMTLKQAQNWQGATNCCAPATGSYCVERTNPFTFDGKNIAMTGPTSKPFPATWQPDQIAIDLGGTIVPVTRAAPIAVGTACDVCPY
jgi:hypothetical protein